MTRKASSFYLTPPNQMMMWEGSPHYTVWRNYQDKLQNDKLRLKAERLELERRIKQAQEAQEQTNLENEISKLAGGMEGKETMPEYYPVIGGKKRHISAKNDTDAFSRMKELEAAQTRPPLVREYLPKWLEEWENRPTKKTRALPKPTTVQTYRQHTKTIVSFLGECRLDELNNSKLNEFMTWMHGERKLKDATITRAVATVLIPALKWALVNKVITEMPFVKEYLILPRDDTTPTPSMSPEFFSEVLQKVPELKKHEEKLFAALALTTGMRPEEIWGLKWADFSPDMTGARLQRTVTYPKKNHPVISDDGSMKTEASARYINIMPWVRDILNAQEDKTGFVFGGDEPLCYSAKGRLERAVKKNLGLSQRGLKIYSFRSTFGQTLKDNGMPSNQIAELLGHADGRMAEKRYAHPREESIKMRAPALEKMFPSTEAAQEKAS